MVCASRIQTLHLDERLIVSPRRFRAQGMGGAQPANREIGAAMSAKVSDCPGIAQKPRAGIPVRGPNREFVSRSFVLNDLRVILLTGCRD
jgi:hypothetical protein